MKIDRSDSNPKSISKAVIKDGDRNITQSSNSKFSNLLDRANDENYEEYTKKLAKDIIAQGEKLGSRIDVRELKAYKSLIMEFLNRVMGHAPRFNKNSKIDRRGRHKAFVTIKRINEELEALTAEVLSNQANNIKILKRIEDIRGLILDIEL